MKKIKVKFLKSPTGVFNLGYNINDVVLIEEKQAHHLIDSGFAKLAGNDENNLPAAMPGRNILTALGFNSVSEVVTAVDTLDELEELSKSSVEQVIKFLHETGHIREGYEAMKGRKEDEANVKAEAEKKARKEAEAKPNAKK